MIPSILSSLRKARLGALFGAIRTHVRGDVLDVGGRNFFRYILEDGEVKFNSWTCLEQTAQEGYSDTRYKGVVGDGENMQFADDSFDAVLNIQVLEHTLHPDKMLSEIARVLKKEGTAVFLIPQTSALHEVPTHYYNFTKYWVEKAFPEAGLEVVQLTPLGGRWSTHASHMLHFFLEAFRVGEYSSPEYRRNFWFYLMFPFMALYALMGIVVGMVFALGDLSEDPNNVLVVAKKK